MSERVVVDNNRSLSFANGSHSSLAARSLPSAPTALPSSTALGPNTTVERTTQRLRRWVPSGLRPPVAAHLRR